jgi:hypothetical protein
MHELVGDLDLVGRHDDFFAADIQTGCIGVNTGEVREGTLLMRRCCGHGIPPFGKQEPTRQPGHCEIQLHQRGRLPYSKRHQS